ncbi:ligand of Numb protein X 2-like [Sycon ciliatum]|uniref:ligand of Numb protein X 2-like n=1 Tax=Sycon ciliatum TaxID=27933 RepID=UPI0031F6CF9E
MGPVSGPTGICIQCGVVHPLDAPHTYRYVGEVDSELLCQICLVGLLEPVDTPCGHTFCFSCIRPYQRLRKSCPVDRKPLSRSELRPSAMLVRRLLDKLPVHCPMRENCQEEVKRAELEEHLRSRCPGMLVPCPRAEICGCEFVGPRCMLERHLWPCLAATETKKAIVSGEAVTIEVPKGSAELGMSIVGGADTRLEGIFINGITRTGVIARDGRLAVGDQILQANGHSLRNATFQQARAVLVTQTPTVTLCILRGKLSPSLFQAEQVEHHRIPLCRSVADDHGLGWGVRFDYKHTSGIVVQQILPGCSVEHLNVGDRLVEINRQDVQNWSQEEVDHLMQVSGINVELLVSRQVKSVSQPHSLQGDDEVDGTHVNSIQSPGTEKIVIVTKGGTETSLGMTVSGGVGTVHGDFKDLPVFVTKLTDGGPAARTGQMQRGDILLSIRGTSLAGRSHQEAVALLKSASFSDSVRFHLIQGDPNTPGAGLSLHWPLWVTSVSYNQVQKRVTLAFEEGSPLGMCLAGGSGCDEGDLPIFVKAISPVGAAADTGMLHPGDQILGINGQPLETACTLDEVIEQLAQLSSPIRLDMASAPGTDF